ncbi:hypothetical protein RchiOBHm_Chr2g0090691 [Rosa chinensis]|uniref:Uncharacterized protein n=1 Tax=Rosa chinensis TaxID=74649 RepID=A0A2P6RJJ7_ROSCH|nr:hypothetical protein RchiOBHm_Chr2g0090691 [Rosa chinensis]
MSAFIISICYQILKDGGLEGYLKKISCWTEEGLLDWVNLHPKQQMVVKPPKVA